MASMSLLDDRGAWGLPEHHMALHTTVGSQHWKQKWRCLLWQIFVLWHTHTQKNPAVAGFFPIVSKSW